MKTKSVYMRSGTFIPKTVKPVFKTLATFMEIKIRAARNPTLDSFKIGLC